MRNVRGVLSGGCIMLWFLLETSSRCRGKGCEGHSEREWGTPSGRRGDWDRMVAMCTGSRDSLGFFLRDRCRWAGDPTSEGWIWVGSLFFFFNLSTWIGVKWRLRKPKLEARKAGCKWSYRAGKFHLRCLSIWWGSQARTWTRELRKKSWMNTNLR